MKNYCKLQKARLLKKVFSYNSQNNKNFLTKEKIKQLIKTKCSPRHVPSIVLQVNDIPYTINGKKVEVAIKKIIQY